MTPAMDDAMIARDSRLLTELEPVVAAEVDRHLSMAKEWFPHEYVPWSLGEDFEGPLGGRAWESSEALFPHAARTSLVINLLTEDNLPSYHHAIAARMGPDGAWGTWVGRWTAEEGRHSIAIRDYLTVTRAVDPRELERARMVHMCEGFQPLHPGLISGVVYVSFQELATRVSHRNTGAATLDPVAEQLFARIALDENLHMLFYRNLIDAVFDLEPDDTMVAVRDTIRDFTMPGHGIEGFQRKAVEIAVVGIYDLRQHRDEVVMPVLRKWRAMERTDLGPVGEAARDDLARILAEMDVAIDRFESRREALLARLVRD